MAKFKHSPNAQVAITQFADGTRWKCCFCKKCRKKNEKKPEPAWFTQLMEIAGYK